ncbi:MAG: CBS domain-containing protein [Bacteroides sp.]|nr:CBS domain-containing protein [Ruminococcus flavefaciens]MCM1555123.1 CBS domain-containing protein [Bacteroides sp.]
MAAFSRFKRLFGKKEAAVPSVETVKEPDLGEAAPEALKFFAGFSEIEASQIMTPRVGVVSLPLSATFESVIETVQESEYSRLPVFDGDLDHIKGILYIKDLIPHMRENEDFAWQKLLRPAIFVPETRKIENLLKEFKKKRLHIAIVVDEYGGTSGIVTLEDILEELVGEIHDEFDTTEEEKLYQKTPHGDYVFDGRMPIHDLCKLLEKDDDYFDLDGGDYESLAGFVLEKLGYFPNVGTHFNFKEFTLNIEATGENRITRIRMKINRNEN